MNIYIIAFVVLAIVLTAVLLHYYKQKKEKEKEEEAENERLVLEATKYVEENYHAKFTFLNESLLHKEHYFAYSEKEKFAENCKELYEKLDFLRCNGVLGDIGEDAVKLYDALKNLEYVRKNHNNDFIRKELEENKDFFDNVLAYPLDEQQRDSIVKLEDNCLVISSAGSGKTSTMIGKLLYLVRQRKIQPSRILTITYTHKASEELTQRLMGTGLECITFHKLAMEIVGKVSGERPSIADNGLFINVFYDLMSKEKFRDAVLVYLTDYKSLTKSEHDYDSSIEYYNDRKKYGIVALYTDMDDHMIFTKSEEEKKICSYLTELGVDFKYEQAYEYHTMTENYRQYKPDFTIYYTDAEGVERRLYLEHFAINAAGQVPRWFGAGKPDGWNIASQNYHEGIAWKKNLHAEKGTKMVFTTSADFHNKTIREKLERILKEAGVPIRKRTTDELMDKIMTRNKSMEKALLQMTQSFINLVKANNKTIGDVRKKAEAHKSLRDVFVIDNIMKPLWDAYQHELEERNEMDFTDVIVKATKYCEEDKWNKKYDFILIDEFQDISVDRYRFLLSLRTETPKTKLYCVGDDWQSIYRFTGSDLSLFSDFSKYFGYTEECKIETTYRFGNPLIDKSSRFVQNNPLQKKKNVRPRSINPPETKISFMSYKDNTNLQTLMKRMVARIPANKTAYIISRYTYDINALCSPDFTMEYDQNHDSVAINIAGRKVKFMTIHGSKGLEADYVFLLNCNSGLYGFPSLVSDDPVLDYVLSDPEHYEYAEERRVFYVGITRAKVHTIVLYNEDTPSPFVSEMNANITINPNPCPWCGVGHRILKYEGWTKQKTPYKVWGCDNREANCQYFEREFYKGDYMQLKGRKFIYTKRRIH